jgi:hypothetical protein
VLVAGSGGGIRAAYWTTAVLDCIVNRVATEHDPCGEEAPDAVRERRLSTIFAMSGISGSSLGLATFAVGSVDSPTSDASAPGPALRPDGEAVWKEHGWYRSVLDDDYLTPTLTRWLFNDLPNVWLRADADANCSSSDTDHCSGDRAAALEQAWERAWQGTTEQSPLSAGFLEWQTRSGAAHLPLLILNSYSVEDGCRFNVSALVSNGARRAEQCRVFLSDMGGTDGVEPVLDATTDLLDFGESCSPGTGQEPIRDLPIATAVLLSARFPFVTPSGKLSGGCGGTTYLVDGGYRDTSAASTLVELWPSVLDRLATRDASTGDEQRPARESIFIQIDNGYDEAAAPHTDRRPNELLVPTQGRDRAMGGIANASKQGAERTFDCFIRITTHAHPGSQAPLGWVLSSSSLASLDSQLKVNAAELERARNLLDGSSNGGPATTCRP